MSVEAENDGGASGSGSSGTAPILRLLARPRTPLAELSAVRNLLEASAPKCGEALREFSTLDAEIRLDSVEQAALAAVVSDISGGIDLCVQAREWDAPVLVRLEPLLLFRMLDAMYGGDPARRQSVPKRPLTPLERAIAMRVAAAIVAPLETAIRDLCAVTFDVPGLMELPDAQGLAACQHEYVVVRLGFGEQSDFVVVALPAAGLEPLRDRLTAGGGKTDDAPDLTWNQLFRESVLAANMALTAVIDGPSMTIDVIAGLKQGTLLEVDTEALGHVSLESGDRAVYLGRLGQSRGMFTVCLEAPAAPSSLPRDAG
jgi:flagellar motor switch protein FliM